MVRLMISIPKSGKTPFMSPADVLERMIKEAVLAKRWKSPAKFFEEAGFKSRSQLGSYRARLQRDPAARLSSGSMVKIARTLGISVDELERRMYGEHDTGGAGGKYPSREYAISAARDLQLPEAAIQAVLAEDPGQDPGRWYWFKRIEAEAMRVAPLASSDA